MPREPPDDYEPGEEIELMSDGALEVAEQTLQNAVGRLEYIERLVPEPVDGGERDDDWYPKSRAEELTHDAEELLREVKTERRSRENESLGEYE